MYHNIRTIVIVNVICILVLNVKVLIHALMFVLLWKSNHNCNRLLFKSNWNHDGLLSKLEYVFVVAIVVWEVITIAMNFICDVIISIFLYSMNTSHFTLKKTKKKMQSPHVWDWASCFTSESVLHCPPVCRENAPHPGHPSLGLLDGCL